MRVPALALVALFFPAAVFAGVFYTNPFLNPTAQSNGSGQTRVLQGIPAIARAFAPVGGVNWKDFANVLAGICAVESKCDPNYPHYVNGSYSQYQGLFQMNMYEVAKAEAALQQMLPQMQAAAASDPEQQKAFDFVKKAIDAARDMSGDRRFHPEYGVILGAAKHIGTNAMLARQYPGDPLRQAAGHLTAQFSGITESKIKSGQFGAPVQGMYGNATTELGALSVNGVAGATTVAGAIEVAGARYQNVMKGMMARMSQVTNGLTTVPDTVAPFSAPAYQPGTSPVLDQPYNGVSSLMETGYLRPAPAPAFRPSAPPSTTNIGGYNPTSSNNSGTGQNRTPTPIYTQPSTGPSVGFLLVQPRSVQRGTSLLLSWSSVGMDAKNPCQVSYGGATFAIGNEGSKSFPTSGISSGPLTFTLSCTTAGGQQFTQSTSATVR